MRVVLADDHSLFRAGLASLLEAWGIEVVGEAGNGREAVELAMRQKPDLVLMDIGMPEGGGLQATREIKAAIPDVKVVIVTASDDGEDLFEAIKSGAEGYLLKGMSEEEFIGMLRGIEAGEPPLSSGIAAKILEEFGRVSRAGPPRESDDDLTPREREVLQLVATGATNREIAAALFVSENTVNFHMKHVLAKLHVKNRAEAAAYAVRRGLAGESEGRS